MSIPTPDTPVPTPTTRSRTWSQEEIHALGVTTDLLTAASVLRIGRTRAYHLARTGEFPVPVLRTGRRYLVAVAHLLQVLGIDTTGHRGLPFAHIRASIGVVHPADSAKGTSL